MAKQANVISQWCHLLENFQTSSLGFYESVEAAVQARAVPETERTRIEHKEGGLASAKREYLRIRRGRHAFDICAAPFGTGFFVSWWFTEPPLPLAILVTLALFFGIGMAINIALGVGTVIGAMTPWPAVGEFIGRVLAFLGIPALLLLLGWAMRQGRLEGESTVLSLPVIGWIYESIFSPSTYYKIDTALMFQDAVHHAVLEVIDCVAANKGVRALTEAERKPILKRFGPSA